MSHTAGADHTATTTGSGGGGQAALPPLRPGYQQRALAAIVDGLNKPP